ncbi:MAG: hypothetical protein JXA69_03135 [Phycisphaerae bacterium]|nr:hypothetical protein [Phycisphaerae bacterium]
MTILAESLAWNFTIWDWGVLFGYLALTTAIGAVMTGKPATIRDFFLGGRKLPWLAVSISTIATEISAVTFVGVPAIVFGGGLEGNFKYLQLGLFGSVLARIVVAFVMVPTYYRREIYSPYDYMANEIGTRARTVTTCLFVLGGALAQGARVYLTAFILDIIIGKSFFGTLADQTGIDTQIWCIYTIGVIAILWAWIGGVSTIIWTDLMLFLVFMFGAIAALIAIVIHLPGTFFEGVATLFREGYHAEGSGSWGRFTFFDFDMSPARQYTMWTALIASVWGGLGAYGTDQMMVQRIFCCKGVKQARRAVLFCCFGQFITLTMAFVGVGLFTYYKYFPLAGEAAELVAAKRDRILPVFVLEVLPVGMRGLVFAGIFAAALSTLVAVIAAYSQTTLSAFYLPWRQRRQAALGDAALPQAVEDRRMVSISRILVVVWGLALCMMAQVAHAASDKFPEILNLALSMAGYAGGALLAGYALAFFRVKVDDRGFIWSAPLSVLLIFSIVWHDPWTHPICWGGAIILLFTWVVLLMREALAVAELTDWSEMRRRALTIFVRDWPQTLILITGLAIMLWINHYGYLDATMDPVTGKVKYTTVAWPWFTPIGSTTAFVFGFLLARRKERAPEVAGEAQPA